MKDIDLYYESLKEVYDQIAHWHSEEPSIRSRFCESCNKINTIFTALSVMPVIPIILYSILRHMRVDIWLVNFTEFTIIHFIVVWVVVSLFFAALFPIIDFFTPKYEKPKGPPQSLSPDQSAFIAVYEAYKEIKIYFVSHIDQHVEKCTEAVWRMFPRPGYRITSKQLRMPNGSKARIMRHPQFHQGGFPHQVYVAEMFLKTFEKYEWLNLDSDTKLKIQALVEFPEKILSRLIMKEDLPSILSVLESLAWFTYAYLPLVQHSFCKFWPADDR